MVDLGVATAGFGIRVHVGLELADGDDHVLGPDSNGEGAGAMAQNGIWAIVGLLQGWDDAAAVHPDEGGWSTGSSCDSWWPKLCFLGREKAGVSRILVTFLKIWSTEGFLLPDASDIRI